MPYRLVPIAVVVLALITGCGSSRQNGVNFHSASRRYTVKQVKASFSAEGIRLRKATNQPISGYVILQAGHKPHVVAAAVEVSAPDGYLDPSKPSPDYRSQEDGNVAVSFDPSEAASVKTALSRLH